MIIDRLHVPHPVLDELIVKSRPKFRADLDSKRDDPFACTREQNEQRRAVVPGEIDAVIEFAAPNRGDCSKSGKPARHDQQLVNTSNRWRECLALRRNHQRYLGVRKFLAYSL